MKKTLIALAAVAASSAALAQSTVTLYGVVDASVESVKGDDSVTRVSSGNHTSSRFGVRGVEDIGGGLKGKFVLESPVNVDTGAAGSGVFWDRQAWLGLQGGFGEIRLGRTDTSIGDITGNTALLGGQAYDDLRIVETFGARSYRRTDNSITYLLPTLVTGLSAQVQYGTGEENPDNDEGKHYGLSVQYAQGAFGAGLGYIYAKDGADEDVKNKGVLAYVSYNFGPAKLTGYVNRDSKTGAAEDLRVYGVRVDIPVSDTFKAQASVSKSKDIYFGARGDDEDATIVALKGTYSLSKRTAVYGLFTHVSNGDDSNRAVASATLAERGKNSRGLALGVVHAF